MRIPGKWLTAGGLAVALATVMPTMATAAGGRPTAAGGRPTAAGQRVIYSYSGLTPPASLITLIKHGEATFS